MNKCIEQPVYQRMQKSIDLCYSLCVSYTQPQQSFNRLSKRWHTLKTQRYNKDAQLPPKSNPPTLDFIVEAGEFRVCHCSLCLCYLIEGSFANK